MPDSKPLDRDGDGGAARNMSLRDWFAGQALVALIQTNDHPDELLSAERATLIAYVTYRMADALIKEGAK